LKKIPFPKPRAPIFSFLRSSVRLKKRTPPYTAENLLLPTRDWRRKIRIFLLLNAERQKGKCVL